jgi:hypothetical protein
LTKLAIGAAPRTPEQACDAVFSYWGKKLGIKLLLTQGMTLLAVSIRVIEFFFVFFLCLTYLL